MAIHIIGDIISAITAKNINIIPIKIMNILVKKLTILPVKLVKPKSGTKRSLMLSVKEIVLSKPDKSIPPTLVIFNGVFTNHQYKNL